MKKKILLISVISTLVLGVTAALGINGALSHGDVVSAGNSAPVDGDEYDAWSNGWSKPGHVYFHYNRGAGKTDYNEFCLWIWNDNTDTDGTLWAYSGRTDVSSTLELVPMSTSWMTNRQLGISEDDNIYVDQYGAICDVDLSGETQLLGGKKKKGAADEKASYDGCDDLGFLFPRIESMDGSSHWISDGGKDCDLPDWKESQNWRDLGGGASCEHIFLASGTFANDWAYYAGSGIPQVKINPMDVDTTGNYSSKVETIPEKYTTTSPTSEEFKKLGVGYQIFVASFRDSNGDGYGDIRGIIDSLDYLKGLGVDVLWLTPIQKSDSYHGYDISDYYAVDPKFGTVDDYRELLFKAHSKGMKVLMDLVLNHTSKSNVWFTKSQWGVNSGAPGAETDNTGINWRNVYTWKYATDKVWRAKREGGKIKQPVEYEKIPVSQAAADPNGPSWYKDGDSNYYYYGKFGSGMPEINYECKDTRKLVIDMAKYWMSFGLDGFRLDAVKHIYMKDEVENTGSDIIITDVGDKTAYDEEKGQYINQVFDYSSDMTKNVIWWKEFSHEVKKIYPNCFLVGENFDGYGNRVSPYFQGLDSQFDFANYYHVPSVMFPYGAAAYAAKEELEVFTPARSATTTCSIDGETKTIPGGNRPDFIDGAFTSNHDVMRAINQANGTLKGTDTDPKVTVTGTADEIKKAKLHAATTILHPGVSWIYYGDELGMSSNTEKHIAMYDNENSMDIWYRQPMMWQDDTVRPNYRAGKYKFTYDSYNSQLFTKGMGVKQEGNSFSSKNEMYAWYKDLCEIKGMYPDNARVDYSWSGNNVLCMNVTGSGSQIIVYLSIGYSSEPYSLNPGQGFSIVKRVNCSTNIGDDFGGSCSIVVCKK